MTHRRDATRREARFSWQISSGLEKKLGPFLIGDPSSVYWGSSFSTRELVRCSSWFCTHGAMCFHYESLSLSKFIIDFEKLCARTALSFLTDSFVMKLFLRFEA